MVALPPQPKIHRINISPENEMVIEGSSMDREIIQDISLYAKHEVRAGEKMIIRLKNVKGCSSTTVNMFVNVHKRLKENNAGPLILCECSDLSKEQLLRYKFDKLFHIADSFEDAIKFAEEGLGRA